MNTTVIIDWKFMLSLGAAAAGVILVLKLDAEAAQKVSVEAFETIRDFSCCK